VIPLLTSRAWPWLPITLLVFGFAPGAALRLIVLAFPKNDPRRRELIGELYNVPRLAQPYWVAQQLEVALFEGLAGRVRSRLRRYEIRKRIVTGLRAEKDDFLNARYSPGEMMVGIILASIPGFIVGYIGIRNTAGCALVLICFGFEALHGYIYQHAKKKRKRDGLPFAMLQLDAWTLLILGPPVYAMTAYSFIRNMVMLFTSHSSGGYWAGMFISVIVLWMPWNEFLVARSFAKAEDKSSPTAQSSL
jgi:hypothetical protein